MGSCSIHPCRGLQGKDFVVFRSSHRVLAQKLEFLTQCQYYSAIGLWAVVMDNLSSSARGWRHTLHLMSLLRKRETTPEKWLQDQAAPERKYIHHFHGGNLNNIWKLQQYIWISGVEVQCINIFHYDGFPACFHHQKWWSSSSQNLRGLKSFGYFEFSAKASQNGSICEQYVIKYFLISRDFVICLSKNFERKNMW